MPNVGHAKGKKNATPQVIQFDATSARTREEMDRLRHAHIEAFKPW